MGATFHRRRASPSGVFADANFPLPLSFGGVRAGGTAPCFSPTSNWRAIAQHRALSIGSTANRFARQPLDLNISYPDIQYGLRAHCSPHVGLIPYRTP